MITIKPNKCEERGQQPYHISGCCHCGNISFEMELLNELSAYMPRACDCEFCSKHGASYISDRDGTLSITVKNKLKLNKYKIGSGIADFLVCNECGVLIGVCYETKGRIYSSINSKTVSGNVKHSEEVAISPKQLTDVERIERWKEIWFNNVTIEYDSV